MRLTTKRVCCRIGASIALAISGIALAAPCVIGGTPNIVCDLYETVNGEPGGAPSEIGPVIQLIPELGTGAVLILEPGGSDAVAFMPWIGLLTNPFSCASSRSVVKRRALSPQ